MKIQTSRFASLISTFLLAFASSAAPASASSADPTVTTPAAFTLSGNTLAVSTQPVWVDGSIRTITNPPGVVLQAFACSQPIATGGTSFTVLPDGPDRFLPGGISCGGLFTTSSVGNPFTAGATPFSSGDISATHIDAAGMTIPYSNRFSTQRHIILVSMVKTSSAWHFSYSASQQFTFVPVVPSVASQPTLAISGSNLTVSPAAWSSGSASNRLVACPSAAVSAVTTPTSTMLGGGMCQRLYDAQTGQGINISDISTAWTSIAGPRVLYDPQTHPRNIYFVSEVSYQGVSGTEYLYIATAPVLAPLSLVVSPPSPSQAATTPYTGPIVTPPAAVSFRPGGKAVLPGSNLSGVSKVSVAGLDANVKVNSAGELEITVPSSLKPGVYDLVIVSDSGTLTVQDGLRVAAGSSSVGATSEARPSTKLKEDNTAKVWVFDVVGAGKVQIFHNDKEIAWVNTTDSSDSKLTAGYLVRTVDLAPGKNVIEVYVDGERVKRAAYTR